MSNEVTEPRTLEVDTTDTQTLRVDTDGQALKISIMKGSHHRGIATLDFGTAADVTGFLRAFLRDPTPSATIDQ